jgi:hypothetical protein
MPGLYLSGPYAVEMLVEDQISTDAGKGLGTEMHDKNLRWPKRMMEVEPTEVISLCEA